MSTLKEIRIPIYPECWETCGSCAQGDITVWEILVKPGDTVKFDDNVITLETGKVALELPSVFRLPTQRHYAANCCSC